MIYWTEKKKTINFFWIQYIYVCVWLHAIRKLKICRTVHRLYSFVIKVFLWVNFAKTNRCYSFRDGLRFQTGFSLCLWFCSFSNQKYRSIEKKKKHWLTYRLIDETLGTLSCEQIPSANNRSRISQANIVGFSRL